MKLFDSCKENNDIYSEEDEGNEPNEKAKFATNNNSKKSAKYRLYKDDIWETLLKGLKCKNCSKPNLIVNHCNKNGFQCEVQIYCTACDFINNKCVTSPYENNSIEINELMTNVFLDIGAGYSGVQKFGSELNMEIMSHTTFAKYVDVAHQKTVKLSENCLESACEVVRKVHSEVLGKNEDKDGILDIAVSFDGSWHTRGHSSSQGLGAVVDILTGLVIDYEVLSNNCATCNSLENSPNKEKLINKHKESGFCEINFEGSSGAMEARAAEILWMRSVQKCKMRYIVLLSELCSPMNTESIKKK